MDEDGDDTVRVRDGVRVRLRESGRRKEMFLILSNGDGCSLISHLRRTNILPAYTDLRL